LLGVLPGTGGLTRLSIKEKFAAIAPMFFPRLLKAERKTREGVGMIDDYFPTSKFQESIDARVREIAKPTHDERDEGIKLNPLQRN